MNSFYHVLGSNLVANVTNFTVWFALTFYTYLQTQSVFATGMIAGIFLVLTAGSGFWFGSIVDHNRKKWVMIGSSVVSLLLYFSAFCIYASAPVGTFTSVASPMLWIAIITVMIGVIAGNIRTIALSTLVTLLVPEDRRDKANGLVGMVSGLGFLTTSVISGFLVAWGGMYYTLLFALIATLLVIVHLSFLPLEGDLAETVSNEEAAPGKIDIKGTLKVIGLIPGLMALILFATFNNFLGGIFMALMDAYGLSLVRVEVWGLLFGFMSIAFIVSGILVAKFGLGKNPLHTLLTVNCIAWISCIFFTIQPSIILLAIGMFIWMFISPIAEASEQTTLQKVVPVERQGRVFGFAQSVEQAASPLTAFMIGPLTQFVFIPFMTTGLGAQTIGWWFGTGPARGIALVFTLAGIVGLIVTILAFRSRPYRRLSEYYLTRPAEEQVVTA